MGLNKKTYFLGTYKTAGSGDFGVHFDVNVGSSWVRRLISGDISISIWELLGQDTDFGRHFDVNFESSWVRRPISGDISI